MCRIDSSVENKKILLLFSLFVIISCCLAEEQKSFATAAVRVNNPKTGLACSHSQTEELRCYCNLPRCVLQGYMCKSRIGCFVQLLVSESSMKTIHGCVEVLPVQTASRCCSNNHQKNQVTEAKQTLVCCATHVCNHIDDPHTKMILNHTFGILPNDYESETKSQQKSTPLYPNSEIWFRAAIIAVPICGVVIVVGLIVTGCKILRSENEVSAHHKLGPQMYVIPSKHKRDQPTKLPVNNYQCYMNRKSFYSPLSPIIQQPYTTSTSQQHHYHNHHHHHHNHDDPLLVAQDFVDSHSFEFIPDNNSNKNASNINIISNSNSDTSVILESGTRNVRESLTDSKINLVEHHCEKYQNRE